MQEIKAFVYGTDLLNGGKINMTPIPDQINEYLKNNPDRTAKSICTFVGNGYKESFVIFDIQDASTEAQKNGNSDGTGDRRTAGYDPDRRNEKIINKGVKNNGKN